jgi:hypothetical protein
VSVGRKALEAGTRELHAAVKEKLAELFGPKVGFAILLFNFGAGSMAYLSNAERDSMISLVKEWLALLEGGLTTDPPGPRAVG